MSDALTHASFFSGVGGLDLGLERAGWRTVSFSEIEPYARAILEQRWPGVPQLGDIVALADAEGRTSDPRRRRTRGHGPEGLDWRSATLWSGGFPCQDLSVAGRRTGFMGSRSSLAFAFLALVERHRPPAVLLENVPGLLTSHRGRDLGTLLGQLGELGYGWAFRVLDAQHFGVPQRRRRVFILGLHADRDPRGDGAAEVLSVGARCDRHPPTGGQAGSNAADGLDAGLARSLSTSQQRIDADSETFIVNQADHTARGGTADGLAGRLDAGGLEADAGIVTALTQGLGSGGPDAAHAQAGWLIPVYVKGHRAASTDDDESWREGDVSPTLNSFDGSDQRATVLAVAAGAPEEHPLLPKGLDSNRYRCCGNGVVAPVGEWIGARLAAWFAQELTA